MGLQVAPILKIFLINLIRGGNSDSRTPQPPPQKRRVMNSKIWIRDSFAYQIFAFSKPRLEKKICIFNCFRSLWSVYTYSPYD